MRDLLLTTEPVADDESFFIPADSRKKDALSERLGDLILVDLEAEGTSHAAATGVQKLNIGSGGTQNLHLVLHALSGVMMTVAMDDDLLVDLRRAVIGRVLYEELAEEKRLVAKLCSARIVGEQIGQFVTEDRSAAWFENDDGSSSG